MSGESTNPEPPQIDVEALDREATAEREEGKRLMISGAAIGVLDVAAIALLGVGCPLCAVGAPALLGWGAYRRWKAKELAKKLDAARAARAEAAIVDAIFVTEG